MKKPAMSAVGEDGYFTDPRDGQKYRTVKIGNIVWMAENLNYKIDNSWCYDDDDSNGSKYGRLYTWDAAMKACPAGWHLPARNEWNNLCKAVGGLRDGHDWEVAGKKLKSKIGWAKNGNGTDEFGFSALPGGARRYHDDSFSSIGDGGQWWSATEYRVSQAWSRFMSYCYDCVTEFYYVKGLGFSVRCIRD